MANVRYHDINMSTHVEYEKRLVFVLFLLNPQ